MYSRFLCFTSAWNPPIHNHYLILLHSLFQNGTNTTYNDGTILGRSFTVDLSSECYTSSLCVIHVFSPDMVGKPVRCVHDNGTATKEIGTLLIEHFFHTNVVTSKQK